MNNAAMDPIALLFLWTKSLEMRLQSKRYAQLWDSRFSGPHCPPERLYQLFFPSVICVGKRPNSVRMENAGVYLPCTTPPSPGTLSGNPQKH